MINECIEKINELKFKSVKNPDIEINRKIPTKDNPEFNSPVLIYQNRKYRMHTCDNKQHFSRSPVKFKFCLYNMQPGKQLKKQQKEIDNP